MKSALVARTASSIALKDLTREYIKRSAEKNKLFDEEFQDIHQICQSLNLDPDHYARPENEKKNRYSFIHGYENSMVQLHREKKNSNYINASFIDGFHLKSKFIATQGPLENTIGDFWEMVWEQNSTVIVMMANVEEHGEIKCNKYWPDAVPLEYNGIRIELTEERIKRDFVHRKFALSKQVGSEKVMREVNQLQFKDWPDRAVPVTTTGIIRLNEEMNRLWRKSIENSKDSTTPGPIITHCSAGVGRTGTFICYDILCDMSQEQDFVDVPLVVIAMRKCRTMMLQTLSQYNFVHKLLWEKLNLPQTNSLTDEYCKANKSDNGLRTANGEFPLLEQVRALSVDNHTGNHAQMDSSSAGCQILAANQIPNCEKWEKMVSLCRKNFRKSFTNGMTENNENVLQELSKNDCKSSWLLFVLLDLYHQMSKERTLDIFRTVKDAFDKNPAFNITLEEYSSLHHACVEYLTLEGTSK